MPRHSSQSSESSRARISSLLCVTPWCFCRGGSGPIYYPVAWRVVASRLKGNRDIQEKNSRLFLGAGALVARRSRNRIVTWAARRWHKGFQCCHGRTVSLGINTHEGFLNDLHFNLFGYKGTDLLHCLSWTVVYARLGVGLRVSGSDEILRAFQVEIPSVTSRL